MSSNMLQNQKNPPKKPFCPFCHSHAVAAGLYSLQSSMYAPSFCVEEPADAAHTFKQLRLKQNLGY